MTIFFNFETQQAFSMWLEDDQFDERSPMLTRWREHGWIPLLTNTALNWNQLMPPFTKLSRDERLKLERKLFA